MTKTTRITETRTEVIVEGWTFLIRHEADRSWTLMGMRRHGEVFEDGGFRTKAQAIAAAEREVERMGAVFSVEVRDITIHRRVPA